MKKPFILDFSVARGPEVAPEFQYDEGLNLNTIMRRNEKIPFVDSDINILELATKTEVKREEDEPNEEILEYQTSPRIDSEQNRCGPSPFMELLTKTKIQREGDDE
jgi:hypothetical protein